MSLLNDALKAAEQRQDKPAPSPYVGQAAAAPSRRRNTGKVLASIAVVALLAAGAYLYLDSAEAPVKPAVTQVALDSQGGNAKVAEPTAPPAGTGSAEALPASGLAQSILQEPEAVQFTGAGAEPDPDAREIALQGSPEPGPQPVPETVQPEVAAPATTQQEPAANAEEKAVAEVAEPNPAQRGPEPPARTANAAGADEPEPATKTAQTGDGPTASELQSVPTADANIIQTRQTPAQQDLTASKDIRKLVSSGDLAAAEATLTKLADTQTAPQSRYAFARGVLARGNVDQALAWVPEDLAARYPDLRLIRARAILSRGDLDQAVATLQSGVPPVADNVEYRVTLATLLQQQGQSSQAANHWAELIAWDNGQAPWWVGLAIALEGRGDLPAARRAYQQAAALPGLAPSLSEYVRQRLQTLGAG